MICLECSQNKDPQAEKKKKQPSRVTTLIVNPQMFLGQSIMGTAQITLQVVLVLRYKYFGTVFQRSRSTIKGTTQAQGRRIDASTPAASVLSL